MFKLKLEKLEIGDIKGTEKGFSWELVLAYRSQYSSPLVQKPCFISVENGFADIWNSKRDYEDWKKKQRANNEYLERELPKAKRQREQAIETAKNAGATEHQLRQDFNSNYEARVMKYLPYNNVSDSRVSRVPLAPERFQRLIEAEAEKMEKEGVFISEALISLFEVGKIYNGLQPALRVKWRIKRE